MNLTLGKVLSRVFICQKLAFGESGGRIRAETEHEYDLGMRSRRQVISAERLSRV